MKSFKNQNWLFLLVIFTINTPYILSLDFFDAEPETNLTADQSESMTEMTDLTKERQEKEIQERIERIKQKDIFKDRTADGKERFSTNIEKLVRNNPTLSDSEINNKANLETIQPIQDDFSNWEKVEKPTSPSLEKNTSVKNVGDIAQKAKEVVKNFKDWLNDLVNPKNMTIKEAKENITNKRNKNLDSIKKDDLEKVTAQELKQRALKEVKEFESQVGSLSLGSGDSTAVFARRLKATQDIYTENAELLQKQFDTYEIPKIVVAARPNNDSDPNNYTFNIIDLGQKEAGSDQTLQQRLDTIVTQRNIAENNSPENIKAFDKDLLKVSYEIKVRQNLDLSTPEIIEQLKTYLENKYKELMVRKTEITAPIKQDQFTPEQEDQQSKVQSADSEIVEKPTSPSLEKNTSVKNVGDIAQKAKEVVKNFKDWLNDLVNPKNMTIKEAKENITNKRNENLDSINKDDLEKVTAQELKQRALKEVKEFESQVGSLSFGSGDSAGVFRQRLQATQDIYTENAKLLQKQFDTYDIPKIVVAARPQDDLDPNNYTFNIIDLGQKELGSDQTLKTHLDRILINDAIPTTFNSEKIQEFNEKLLTDKTDENIQNLKKEFLKIAYEIKVRQNLDLTTPEIQQQLVEYVIKKKAQIAEDSL